MQPIMPILKLSPNWNETLKIAHNMVLFSLRTLLVKLLPVLHYCTGDKADVLHLPVQAPLHPPAQPSVGFKALPDQGHTWPA